MKWICPSIIYSISDCQTWWSRDQIIQKIWLKKYTIWFKKFGYITPVRGIIHKNFSEHTLQRVNHLLLNFSYKKMWTWCYRARSTHKLYIIWKLWNLNINSHNVSRINAWVPRVKLLASLFLAYFRNRFVFRCIWGSFICEWLWNEEGEACKDINRVCSMRKGRKGLVRRKCLQ